MPGLLGMEDINFSRENGKQAVDRVPPIKDNATVKTQIANGVQPEANNVVEKQSSAMNSQAVNASASQNAPSQALAGLLDGVPPELPHISAGFYSLGELIGRVTQESFNGLTGVMDEMSRMRIPIRPGPALTNGLTSHTASDDVSTDSPANQEKKRKFLEWSQTTRERLIKLLVLTTWSSKMDDLRKLMDVLAYLRESDMTYWQVANSIGEIKRRMYPFKLPAPNLPHAAEVLSRGTAAWMGEFYDYIPRVSLTPQETLKALRNMDVLLNTRLILHEDLPVHLRNYEIQNGRATFVFHQEFELDVTLASEDLSKQLYFIDLRFLFDPAPDLGSSRTRDRMQLKVDELLGTVGLASACDFLRNFVLTHKITTWRRQALELQSSYWNKLLRVDLIHRSLVINYWYGSPMPKSWVELGVNSGKTKNGKPMPQDQVRPRLGLRWFRAAKKVPEAESPTLELQHLSVEGILKTTTAMHISYLLQSVERSILSALGKETTKLQANSRTSDIEPSDCALELRLGQSLPKIALGLEPISGKFFISPPSKRTDRTIWELNQMNNPGSDAGLRLMNFMYSELHHQIRKQTERREWTVLQVKSLTTQQLKDTFGREVSLLTVFHPKGWETTTYAIAVTIDANAEAWWTVKFARTQSQDGQSQEKITAARSLDVSNAAISQDQLAEIEQTAVCSITNQSAVDQLKAMGIDHHLKHPASTNDLLHQNHALESILSSLTITRTGAPAAPGRHQTPFMIIRNSHLIPDLSKPSPIFGEHTTIRYENFSTSTGTIHLTASASLTNAQRIAAKLAMIEDDTLKVTPNGSFELALKIKLGASYVEPLIQTLRSLAQLRTFVAVIDRRKLELREVSTRSLTFAYPSDPEKMDLCNLTCTLNLRSMGSVTKQDQQRKRGSSTDRISITMDPSNPHHTLTTLLESYLNANPQTGFQALVNGLALSLPLCIAFVEIKTGQTYQHPKPSADEVTEKAANKKPDTNLAELNNPNIHVHRPDSWKIVYNNPASTWMLVLRPWRSKLHWQLTEVVHQPPPGHHQQQPHPTPFSRTPTGSPREEALTQDLQKLFSMGNTGPGWRGYKTLIVAEMGTGIADALREVNTILRRHRGKDQIGRIAGADITTGADASLTNGTGGVVRPPADKTSATVNGTRAPPKSAASGSRSNAIALD